MNLQLHLSDCNCLRVFSTGHFPFSSSVTTSYSFLIRINETCKRNENHIIDTWGRETLRQKNEDIWRTEFNFMCWIYICHRIQNTQHTIPMAIHTVQFALIVQWTVYTMHLTLSCLATLKTKWLNHSTYYLFIRTTNICVQIHTSKWIHTILWLHLNLGMLAL